MPNYPYAAVPVRCVAVLRLVSRRRLHVCGFRLSTLQSDVHVPMFTLLVTFGKGRGVRTIFFRCTCNERNLWFARERSIRLSPARCACEAAFVFFACIARRVQQRVPVTVQQWHWVCIWHCGKANCRTLSPPRCVSVSAWAPPRSSAMPFSHLDGTTAGVSLRPIYLC
jgi:hypothetical protein